MWPFLNLHSAVYEQLLISLKESHKEKAACKLKDILKISSIPPKYTILRCLNPEKNLFHVKKTVNKREKERSNIEYNIQQHNILNEVIIIENTQAQPLQRYEKEVVIDVACGTAVLRGSDIFKTGILSMTLDIQKDDIVSIFIDLDGKCLKGFQSFNGNKLFIANGISMVCRKDIFSNCHLQHKENEKCINGVGIRVINNIFYHAPSLDNLLPSVIFPQNFPSLVCVHALSPVLASTVLDMCAAPGGKTTHIASIVGEKGRVVALDKNNNKIMKLRQNLERLNITNVTTFAFDSTLSYDPLSDDSLQPPFKEGTFDSILVDAPCSGLGQRPCFSHRNINKKQFDSYPVIQKRILKNAVLLLKPGGFLVYSTCTINPRENEEVVAWLLKKFPCMSLHPQDYHCGGYGWKTEGLTEDHLKLLQRFDPSVLVENDHSSVGQSIKNLDLVNKSSVLSNLKDNLITPENDTIGFFIAKFMKT